MTEDITTPYDIEQKVYINERIIGSAYTITICAFTDDGIKRIGFDRTLDKKEIDQKEKTIHSFSTKIYKAIKNDEDVDELIKDFNHHCHELTAFVLEDKHTFLEEIYNAFDKDKVTGITYLSNKFIVPFELMTDKQLIDSDKIQDHLFGAKFAFLRQHSDNSYNQAVANKENVRIASLQMLSYDQIKAVELPYLQDISSKNPKFKHINLNEEQFKNRDELINVINKCECDIIHFACHLETTEVVADCSFHFDNDIQLEVDKLRKIDFKGKSVFLNACNSGSSPDKLNTNIINAMFARSVSNAICVEIPIYDDFAAKFAVKFYEYLAKGKSFSESLYLTKRHFLIHKKQTLGFFYKVYGDNYLYN